MQLPGVAMDVHTPWPIMKRFSFSPGQARSLFHAAPWADIVHNHSLWSMVNVASGWIVPGTGAKLVTSPRGTLSPWALSCSRSVKRVVKPLQWRALHRADLLHATSEVEVQQIRDAGFRAPVVVVPNGIDLPPLPGEKPLRSGRTLLYLSRIHPIKGVDRLLTSWSALQNEFPEWRLVIAGPGRPAHLTQAHDLVRTLKLKRVELPGPLYGADKTSAYFQADLFVLPTHSENFGVVIAEALAHGCPVVVGMGAPWRQVEKRKCGWWVSNEVDELAGSLRTAMTCSPEELGAMGTRGRDWMEQDFGWTSIARRMSEAYRWVLGDSAATTEIHL